MRNRSVCVFNGQEIGLNESTAKHFFYMTSKHQMFNFYKTLKKKSNKYRVVENITEYPILSKLIFLRIIIPEFMKIRKFFHV